MTLVFRDFSHLMQSSSKVFGQLTWKANDNWSDVVHFFVSSREMKQIIDIKDWFYVSSCHLAAAWLELPTWSPIMVQGITHTLSNKCKQIKTMTVQLKEAIIRLSKGCHSTEFSSVWYFLENKESTGALNSIKSYGGLQKKWMNAESFTSKHLKEKTLHLFWSESLRTTIN